MDMFGLLQGMSPWWWVALALALGIVEVLTFSFFLIWPGLAALAVGIAMFALPDMSGTTQVLLFAVLSVLFTIAGRQWVVSIKPTSDNPSLNRRSAALIGRSAVVLEGFAGGGVGMVEIDGIRWRARLSEGMARPASGDNVDVTAAEGMVLIIAERP